MGLSLAKLGRLQKSSRRYCALMDQSVLFFIKGLVMGFAMAAPVGPVGVLCIRRTLRSGKLHGFVTGLAVAVADGIFGLIAGLGLTAISQPLIDHQDWIRLIGGVVMLAMGLQIAFARPKTSSEPPQETGRKKRLAANFLSAFAITLSNPMTVISFAAVFVTLGFGSQLAGQPGTTALLVLGVFLGSAAWWATLTHLASYFKGFLRADGLARINLATGVAILAFGIYAIATGAKATLLA